MVGRRVRALLSSQPRRPGHPTGSSGSVRRVVTKSCAGRSAGPGEQQGLHVAPRASHRQVQREPLSRGRDAGRDRNQRPADRAGGRSGESVAGQGRGELAVRYWSRIVDHGCDLGVCVAAGLFYAGWPARWSTWPNHFRAHPACMSRRFVVPRIARGSAFAEGGNGRVA